MYGDMRKLWSVLGWVVLVLAGCSTGGEVSVETVDRDDGRVTEAPTLAPQALRDAANRTARVESARFSINLTMTDVPMTGDLEVTFHGLMLDGGERVGMLLDFAPLFEQLGEDPSELGPFTADDSLTLEYRLVGDHMYMRSPLFALSGLVGADRWIRVDLAKAAEQAGLSGVDIGSLTGTPLGFTSADSLLAFIEATGSETTDLGEVEVRGVSTQGVATVVRLGDLYEQGTEQASDDIRSFFEQMDLGATFDIAVPIEAYVDDDGYVRRLVVHLDMADLAEQLAAEELGDLGAEMIGDMVMTMTLDLYDFGVEAEIDEPDDYVDLTAEFLAGDL